MSHAIDYFITDKRSDIMKIADDFAYCNVDRYENPDGRYHGRMTIHDDIICESYTDALEKIQRLDNGWYDDHAVRYKDKDSLKPNKTMLAIESKMEKLLADKQKYEEEHSVKNRKSKFVGCQQCGSKLSVEHLRREYCPVCGTDLRADYILERLDKYDADYKALAQKYHEVVKNRKDKCPLRWLVKVEVHC